MADPVSPINAVHRVVQPGPVCLCGAKLDRLLLVEKRKYSLYECETCRCAAVRVEGAWIFVRSDGAVLRARTGTGVIEWLEAGDAPRSFAELCARPQ